MNINTNLSNFKKKHKNKKNQIIFHKANCKSNKTIENIINNFLIKKNSFIFESVEKRRFRGRYTIIGANPDKIWEFNKKKIHIIEKNKKKLIKGLCFFLKKISSDPPPGLGYQAVSCYGRPPGNQVRGGWGGEREKKQKVQHAFF